jgi:4-carboxymuconolactone decarboxylase
MKLVKISQVAKEPFDSLGPLFTGPVTIQTIIGAELSKNYFISQVNFGRGIRNKFHTHSTDQILIVTEGKGIVATDKDEITVIPGYVIYIPAGEKHWHGAAKGATFSHLYVMSPDTKTTQLED